MKREAKAVLTRDLPCGIGLGLVAGGAWWLVEGAANWALGGTITLPAALTILGWDLLLGAGGGALLGLLLGSAASAPALALGTTGIYGLLRVYEPPGMRAELLFAVLAALSVLLGGVVAGRERRGPLAFVQLVLLATAATAFGKAGMTEVQSYFAQEEPSALTLVLLLVGLPLAGVAVDRVVGLALRRDGLRLGLELAAAAVALVVWGEPLSTAALDAPMANLPPAAPGAPDVILVSLDTTRADHMSTYGYARETSPNLSALAKDAKLEHFSGSVEDSGEGRWTIEAAIEEAVPADVLAASLFMRFRSRQDHTFAEKVLSAMRLGFGGHVEAPKK